MTQTAQAGPRVVDQVPAIAEIVAAEKNFIAGDIQRLQDELDRNKVLLERKERGLAHYRQVIAIHEGQRDELVQNVATLKRMLVQRQQLHLTMQQDNL